MNLRASVLWCMSPRIRGSLVLWSLLASLLLIACGGDEADKSAAGEDFIYNNAIFQGVSVMQAAASGTSQQPDFSWPATTQKHVACAVFQKRISVRQNLISNPQDVVWLWHSGLGRGRDGNVLYEHGVGNADLAPRPASLSPGTYYWAVWALDEEGLPVAATREYTLDVY